MLIHEYVALDMDRVLEALGNLAPLERFVQVAPQILEGAGTARAGGAGTPAASAAD